MGDNVNDEGLDERTRGVAGATPRRALALGGLTALAGLSHASARDRTKPPRANAKQKKKRGPAGPAGPAGQAGSAGPTGPAGASGPSAGAVLGNTPRSNQITLAAGETKQLEVKCPDNTATEMYFAAGGGFVNFDDDVHIIACHQTQDGFGWFVNARNNGAHAATVEARLTCLRVSRES
ncbi:MAG: hypothetical protein KC442_14115 [Thermomicrobiales bacterium]|nr:hypothetical protein [Thermomicrobiales bacterium]